MLSIIPIIAVKISVCANPLLYIAYNPNVNRPFYREEYCEEMKNEEATNFSFPSLKMMLHEMQQENASGNKTSKVEVSDWI